MHQNKNLRRMVSPLTKL